MKYQKPINPEGFYTGPEVQWNVEDVECLAQRLGYDLDEATLERVLIATFEDNDGLMNDISRHIEATIEYMDNTNTLHPVTPINPNATHD
jgi:hypothetical protein